MEGRNKEWMDHLWNILQKVLRKWGETAVGREQKNFQFGPNTFDQEGTDISTKLKNPTDTIPWSCWERNKREWVAPLTVLWKETIWIELKGCWPHFWVSVKSDGRNSNWSTFGGQIVTCKRIERV